MLGLALPQQDVRSGRDRDGRADVEAFDAADERRALALDLGRRAQERDAVLLLADAGRPRSRTSAGLMPISPASAMASMDRVSVIAGPGDEQLAMDAAGHEEVEQPGADADRHPQHDRAAAQVQPADAIDGALHLPGGPGRPLRVVGAVEHEEQRIAAPLEEAGAPVVGLVEERREHAIERVAHELRADLALAREALGQRREARDVDEDEGRLDLAMELAAGPARSQSMTRRGTYGRRNSFSSGSMPEAGTTIPSGAVGAVMDVAARYASEAGSLDRTGRRTRLHRRAPQPTRVSAGRTGSPPAPRPRRSARPGRRATTAHRRTCGAGC